MEEIHINTTLIFAETAFIQSDLKNSTNKNQV